MRITHYFHHFDLAEGGVCRAVLDMARWQARAGADVAIATYDPRDVPASWKAGGKGLPGVAVLPPHGPARGLLRPSTSRGLDPVLKQTDIIHVHDIWDPVLIPLSRLASRAGIPYIVSPHGMLADWSIGQKALKKTAYRTLFGQAILDRAAFICLTAQGELNQSAKRHPRTPGVAIPLVFDLDPYRDPPTPELARSNLPLPAGDTPLILYLSRHDYKKRPDLLLAAGRVLLDRAVPFHLVFAGPGDEPYMAQLRGYAQQLGLSDRVTFLGMVPAEWKPSLMNAAELFVLPTSMENFGFVYFEALACGTPVVTTKGTDTWPELQSSGAARIVGMIKSDIPLGQVGGGEVGELAAAIESLIAERSGLKPMGHAGRRWVFQNMDPAVVVRRYLDMYQRAIDARTR